MAFQTPLTPSSFPSRTQSISTCPPRQRFHSPRHPTLSAQLPDGTAAPKRRGRPRKSKSPPHDNQSEQPTAASKASSSTPSARRGRPRKKPIQATSTADADTRSNSDSKSTQPSSPAMTAKQPSKRQRSTSRSKRPTQATALEQRLESARSQLSQTNQMPQDPLSGPPRKAHELKPRFTAEEREQLKTVERADAVIAELENSDMPDKPIITRGHGQVASITADLPPNQRLRIRNEEEDLVLKETPFRDGRYGACFNCGANVVIPGLAQFYCEFCGWIKRPVEITTIAPGHHD